MGGVSHHSRVAHCTYFRVRSFVSDLTVNLCARSHCIVGEEERKEKERRGEKKGKRLINVIQTRET